MDVSGKREKKEDMAEKVIKTDDDENNKSKRKNP